ncbi:MAG: type II toxin-antitoxin system VapC family toxin [Armatimonadetes bacterium]|nr:type II toxin-antitoxin system VapC family toxin [Armatimonadota bacterium]
MAVERRTFDAPRPGLVYWDTSFVVASISEDEPFHEQCLAFRQRMEREGVLPVVSDFVFDELAFWTSKGALVAEAQLARVRWQDLRRQRPHVVRTAIARAAVYRAQIETEALKLVIPETVTDRAFQLMQDHALLPTDAYHVATALESGVNAFVTLDQGFLDMDGIIVYTCLP